MKISVITICYNSARHIEKAISSVLGQSYRDVEYVIVDGGSGDGTVGIVAAHAARDPRIKWVSEPDEGISDAMNKGVRMASGEFIAHLHSDEFYLNADVLSFVATKLRNSPGAVWLTGGFHFVDETGRFLREVKVRSYSYRRLIHVNTILHPATFIRREAFNAVGGFDTSLSYCMDYHLWLRLGALSDPIIMKRSLACFSVHSGSRSLAQAQSACAEEFRVRLEFLRRRGSWQLPYRIEYLVRKQLNRIFTKRLVASASDQSTEGTPPC